MIDTEKTEQTEREDQPLQGPDAEAEEKASQMTAEKESLEKSRETFPEPLLETAPETLWEAAPERAAEQETAEPVFLGSEAMEQPGEEERDSVKPPLPDEGMEYGEPQAFEEPAPVRDEIPPHAPVFQPQVPYGYESQFQAQPGTWEQPAQAGPFYGYAGQPQAQYPYQPQNAYPSQPVYGQNPPPPYQAGGYGQAAPQGPTGPYGAPPFYGTPAAAGAAPWAPGPMPKKKLSLGVKVFIWIASILAAAALLGFVGYIGYSVVKNQSSTPPFPYYYGEDAPYPFVEQEPDDGKDEENPDFGVTPPEDEEDDSNRPDIDVTPNTEGIIIKQKPSGEPMDAQEVYERVVKSTVTVSASLKRDGKEQDSTGTGIFATSDGYVITNSHVVLSSKSTTVKITTYDGEEYDAVVVGVDRTTDLAVLKTNDHDFTPAEFGDAEELSIGEWVLAIGNPGGARFSSSLTRGIISGLDREVGKYSENGMTYIQTDAAINPGNSGGPLVNMYGQVVGINSSKIVTDGYEGMGFAIPVSHAQSIINQLFAGGYVKGRTRLGITGQEVSETMAAMYGTPQGFMILEINEESAFTGTKAEVGDVITAIDGETVTGLSDISNLLLRYAPGDKITVTLYQPSLRGEGKEVDVEITLLEDKGETQE